MKTSGRDPDEGRDNFIESTAVEIWKPKSFQENYLRNWKDFWILYLVKSAAR